MSQAFLKDQLKRIREMTEQVSRVHDYATELSHELGQHAAKHRDPLAEVLDFRTVSSPNYDEADRVDQRDREADDARSARRHVARDSRRRRHR
jgi:hypothetical protein